MPNRIQRSRKKGWKKPEGSVCVTRPGKWGNYFKVVNEDDGYWVKDIKGNYWRFYENKEDAVATSINLYESWIEGKIGIGELDISELKGKDLACFCKEGEPCHADLLIKLANE